MTRRDRLAVVVLFSGCLLGSTLALPLARAQKDRGGPQWEYRVGIFAYNPGERTTDEARRKAFERELNEKYAPDGWEPVATILDRTGVQTVGGGVTTRDTVSFVAFRRPRR